MPPAKRKSASGVYGPSEKRDFHVFDKVFARMRGYPPWPAKITNIKLDAKSQSLKNKCEVYFYGTNQLGQCAFSDIHDYEANKERFQNCCQSSKNLKSVFALALEEIENDNGPLLEEIEDGSVAKISFDDLMESDEEKKRGVKRKAEDAEDDTDRWDSDGTEEESSDGRRSTPGSVRQSVSKKQTPLPKKPAPSSKSPATRTPQTKDTLRTQTPQSKDNRTTKTPTPKENLTNKTPTPKDNLTVKTPITKDKTSADSKPVEKHIREVEKQVKEVDKQVKEVDKQVKEVDKQVKEVDKQVTEVNKPMDTKRLKASDVHKTTPRPQKSWTKMLEEKDSFAHLSASPVKSEQQAPRESKTSELRTECSLLALESEIKEALCLHQADFDRAVAAMKGIAELKLTAIMLKKNPQVVDTYRKLERYYGEKVKRTLPQSQWSEFESRATQIRNIAARALQLKFPGLFNIPLGMSFIQHYRDEMVWFLNKTASMTTKDILSLTTHDGFK